MDPGDDLNTRVDALMDGLVADLERLKAIPSIAFPGLPPDPVREAHDLLVTHPESSRPFGIPLGTATGRSTA
ncbi:hypothetical protein AB0G97_36020 [Streptomyces sp. NPDC020755]|uniref:hypothetical protein n=1 Tax=unclassified Streptomyces TaxID=2593676 RepID=UPI002F3F17FC